ncbi:M15 family metallopeptidase [Georgenia phoenicis]|uniref:M15 family metallopeptidase n=1 Tax=unclassified Georgenia TaxID=2626815 RepID=UPI0039AF2457
MSDTAPRLLAARRLLTVLALLAGLAPGLLGCGAEAPTEQPAEPSPPTRTEEPDGRLPHGATVRDEDLAGIARLDPELAAALRRATTDAAADGIGIQVSSGWRSAAYQEDLLDDAVSRYGSREEAARWVATPETSPHVSGEAVDVAPYDAIDWLARHGDRYGLCQIYGNESWHYEHRPDAVDGGCPPMYEDPTQDPRMQR